MISIVSNTTSTYASYNNTQTRQTSANTQNTSTDGFTTTMPKGFFEYIGKFMAAAKNSENNNTDSVFRNAAEVYAKELESISAEELSTLNQAFEMHLKSQAIKPIFQIESVETMNVGYSKFLKDNLNPALPISDHDRKEAQKALIKSENVLNNNKNNADYLRRSRNTIEKYASDFYEEFISAIATNDFDSAYDSALAYSKNSISESGTSYDQLQNLIYNELHQIHDKGYWYKYDPALSSVTK